MIAPYVAAAIMLAAQSSAGTAITDRDKVLQSIMDRAEADTRAANQAPEGFPIPPASAPAEDPMEQELKRAVEDAVAAANAAAEAFGPITSHDAMPDDPDLPWLISDRWSCQETNRRAFNPYRDLEPRNVSYMLSFADKTLTNLGTGARIPVSTAALESEDRFLYIALSEANGMSIGLSGRGETRKLSITTFSGLGIETESTCHPAP